MSTSLAHILPAYRVAKQTAAGEFALELDDPAVRATYLQSLRDQLAGHRPSVTREHMPEDGRAYGRVVDVMELSDADAQARGFAGGGIYASVEWQPWVFEAIQAGEYRFVSGRFIKNHTAGDRVFPLFMSHLTLTADPVFDFGQTELQTLAAGAPVPSPVIMSRDPGEGLFAACFSRADFSTPNEDQKMEELIAEIRSTMAEQAAAMQALTEAVQALTAAAATAPPEAEAANGGEEDEGLSAEPPPAPATPAPAADAGLSKRVIDLEKALATQVRLREQAEAAAEVDGFLSKHEVKLDRDTLIERRAKFGRDYLADLAATAPPKADTQFAGQRAHAAGAPTAAVDFGQLASEIDNAHRAACRDASRKGEAIPAFREVAEGVLSKHGATYTDWLAQGVGAVGR